MIFRKQIPVFNYEGNISLAIFEARFAQFRLIEGEELSKVCAVIEKNYQVKARYDVKEAERENILLTDQQNSIINLQSKQMGKNYVVIALQGESNNAHQIFREFVKLAPLRLLRESEASAKMSELSNLVLSLRKSFAETEMCLDSD